MEIIVNTDKKEYFKCSMYYMRRYFGLREIILLSILLIIGVALFVFAGQVFMLILFAVSVFIILLALTLFLITSVTGYKVDMEKKGVAKQKLEFKEDEEAWVDYVTDFVWLGDEYFDALYYACENGDEMLEEQARYFHERLLDDEKYYYAGRMGGFEV